MISILRF